MTAALQRVVSAELAFVVDDPIELVLQIAPALGAGEVLSEHLGITLEGVPVAAVDELVGSHGARVHALRAECGLLEVNYRAELLVAPGHRATSGETAASQAERAAARYTELVYLRPSRYCPTDHLVGFARSEFGIDTEDAELVDAIVSWIHGRIAYEPGSGTVHDSAEDTLLTGTGTCRDFAHLGVALCRAVGIPARFTSVYAPGLSPMDFHAVFESCQQGRWLVHDPTGLAPRSSMVRIATGRDAADVAFASWERGAATFSAMQVTATVGGDLPGESPSQVVELP